MSAVIDRKHEGAYKVQFGSTTFYFHDGWDATLGDVSEAQKQNLLRKIVKHYHEKREFKSEKEYHNVYFVSLHQGSYSSSKTDFFLNVVEGDRFGISPKDYKVSELTDVDGEFVSLEHNRNFVLRTEPQFYERAKYPYPKWLTGYDPKGNQALCL